MALPAVAGLAIAAGGALASGQQNADNKRRYERSKNQFGGGGKYSTAYGGDNMGNLSRGIDLLGRIFGMSGSSDSGQSASIRNVPGNEIKFG